MKSLSICKWVFGYLFRMEIEYFFFSYILIGWEVSGYEWLQWPFFHERDEEVDHVTKEKFFNISKCLLKNFPSREKDFSQIFLNKVFNWFPFHVLLISQIVLFTSKRWTMNSIIRFPESRVVTIAPFKLNNSPKSLPFNKEQTSKRDTLSRLLFSNWCRNQKLLNSNYSRSWTIDTHIFVQRQGNERKRERDRKN